MTILPVERDMAPEELDETAQPSLNAITAMYKDIDGTPVHNAALVRCGGRSPIEHLDDGELEECRELMALACFSALARREYFDLLGSYCNSDCFSICFHEFDSSGYTGLVTRRREGRITDRRPVEETAFTMPLHCRVTRALIARQS